jgi:Tol biopolymer transport system component
VNAVRLAALTLVLLAVVAPAAHAAFPGADGRILFTSDNRLYTADPAGGAWTRLVADETRQAQAAWSPDGSKVAFRVGPDGDSEIWVVNADGTGAHAITDTLNPGGDPRYSSQPGWSPDGSRIVFRSDRRDNNPDVWVMNADGANPQPLVTTPGDERYPAFSPDASKLVYRSDTDGDPEIYVARSDGTGPVKLTDNALFDSAPAWSPDGRRLAFERGEPGADVRSDPNYRSMDLWTMNADGSDQHPLTSNGVHDEGPAWAPDGSGALVFTRDDTVNSDLWIRNADGGERRLTDQASLEESPDWQAVRQASIGEPIPPPPATPAASTSLASRRVPLSKTGRLAIRIRCTVACGGRVVLLRDRKRLASASFTGPGTVRLRVGPKTLRRVRRAGALGVDVRGATRGSVTLLRPR